MNKKKILALVIVTITLVGPFQYAFLWNDTNSDSMNVLMFLLTMAGLVGSFVLLTEASGKTEH